MMQFMGICETLVDILLGFLSNKAFLMPHRISTTGRYTPSNNVPASSPRLTPGCLASGTLRES